MQKNKNRKGLALGAMVSLVASLFAGVAPAQANTGSVVILPFVGTTFNMLHGEGFNLKYVGDNTKRLTIQVEKPASVDVSYGFNTVAANAELTATNVAMSTATVSRQLVDSTYSSSAVNQIFISAPSSNSTVTSTSASITVKVSIFEDTFADGLWDTANEAGRTVDVVFHPWSALAATVALTTPIVGDTRVTASAALGSAVNVQQLNGRFYFQLGAPSITGSLSANAQMGPDATQSAATSVATGTALSVSTVVAALAAARTVSAQLFYATSGTPGAPVAGEAVTARSVATVAALNYDGLTLSPVASVNQKDGNARINSEFAVAAYAYSGSPATGSRVATGTSLYFTVTGNISAGETFTVNGVAYTSSSTLPTAATPIALATATDVRISTAGLTGNEEIVLTLAKGNSTAATQSIKIQTPVFSAENEGGVNYAAAPGTAVSLDLTVKDQFGVVSSRVQQRVSASVALGGSVSTPVTAAVVDGKVTVAVTPTPATRTGSATVSVAVEHQNVDTGVWTAQGTPLSLTINVTNIAFGFTVSPRAAASASISYALADGKYSWSSAITGSTVVAGTVVTVAGEGLVFSNDGGTTTASDSLTFRTGANGAFSVNVAGTRAGDHEVTFTAGAATAVTTFTIDAAVASAGTDIEVTGPETALPNRTLTYTGSVVDALGNPVADADITVTVLGPVSLILGSQAVKTDVDGEFTFRVQTSANDEGDISVTATYNKNGSATLAKDKISAVALTTVAAPVVVTADAVTVEGDDTVTTGLSTDVVVTVVDADGNALAGRNVSLRSTGPGFLNVQSAVSDTDGKVVVKFIATAQAGEVVITAVVDGKVGTHTLKVEAPVVVVPEVNAVIGSFNGRWAVRVENAKGSVVSVKVGNRWFKFTALNDNYMFSRASRTGAELPVAVYVNGQLENVATITIK